jgi:uncharacterized membrane protein HdeD (DUF308 family)
VLNKKNKTFVLVPGLISVVIGFVNIAIGVWAPSLMNMFIGIAGVVFGLFVITEALDG